MRGRLTLQIASPKGPLVSTPSPRVNERGRNAACREWMSITHLRKWDVSGIEIALDLEIPRISDRSRFVFSGPAEPRIRLVVCFALTSQLKRIVTAVDRAAPARPPSGLRISSTERRSMPPGRDHVDSADGGSRAVAVEVDSRHRAWTSTRRAFEPREAHHGGVHDKVRQRFHTAQGASDARACLPGVGFRRYGRIGTRSHHLSIRRKGRSQIDPRALGVPAGYWQGSSASPLGHRPIMKG